MLYTKQKKKFFIFLLRKKENFFLTCTWQNVRHENWHKNFFCIFQVGDFLGNQNVCYVEKVVLDFKLNWILFISFGDFLLAQKQFQKIL